jgi:hypothetical protein
VRVCVFVGVFVCGCVSVCVSKYGCVGVGMCVSGVCVWVRECVCICL